MKKVILIRSAEAWHNLRSEVRGKTEASPSEDYQSPLTPRGEWQAHLLAKRLKEELQNKEVVLYSSEAQRSQKTARIIEDELREKFEVKFEVNTAFNEIDLGDLEGTLINYITEIPEKFKPFLEPSNIDDKPGEESYRDLIKRSLGKLLELLQDFNQDIIIISHGLTIMTIMETLSEFEGNWGKLKGMVEKLISNSLLPEQERLLNNAIKRVWKPPQFNACINVVEFNNYAYKISKENDTSHYFAIKDKECPYYCKSQLLKFEIPYNLDLQEEFICENYKCDVRRSGGRKYTDEHPRGLLDPLRLYVQRVMKNKEYKTELEHWLDALKAFKYPVVLEIEIVRNAIIKEAQDLIDERLKDLKDAFTTYYQRRFWTSLIEDRLKFFELLTLAFQPDFVIIGLRLTKKGEQIDFTKPPCISNAPWKLQDNTIISLHKELCRLLENTSSKFNKNIAYSEIPNNHIDEIFKDWKEACLQGLEKLKTIMMIKIKKGKTIATFEFFFPYEQDWLEKIGIADKLQKLLKNCADYLKLDEKCKWEPGLCERSPDGICRGRIFPTFEEEQNLVPHHEVDSNDDEEYEEKYSLTTRAIGALEEEIRHHLLGYKSKEGADKPEEGADQVWTVRYIPPGKYKYFLSNEKKGLLEDVKKKEFGKLKDFDKDFKKHWQRIRDFTHGVVGVFGDTRFTYIPQFVVNPVSDPRVIAYREGEESFLSTEFYFYGGRYRNYTAVPLIIEKGYWGVIMIFHRRFDEDFNIDTFYRNNQKILNVTSGVRDILKNAITSDTLNYTYSVLLSRRSFEESLRKVMQEIREVLFLPDIIIQLAGYEDMLKEYLNLFYPYVNLDLNDWDEKTYKNLISSLGWYRLWERLSVNIGEDCKIYPLFRHCEHDASPTVKEFSDILSRYVETALSIQNLLKAREIAKLNVQEVSHNVDYILQHLKILRSQTGNVWDEQRALNYLQLRAIGAKDVLISIEEGDKKFNYEGIKENIVYFLSNKCVIEAIAGNKRDEVKKVEITFKENNSLLLKGEVTDSCANIYNSKEEYENEISECKNESKEGDLRFPEDNLNLKNVQKYFLWIVLENAIRNKVTKSGEELTDEGILKIEINIKKTEDSQAEVIIANPNNPKRQSTGKYMTMKYGLDVVGRTAERIGTIVEIDNQRLPCDRIENRKKWEYIIKFSLRNE